MFQTVSLPYKEKTKDGQPYVEYREDDVQDSVFAAVLNFAYRMFKVRPTILCPLPFASFLTRCHV